MPDPTRRRRNHAARGPAALSLLVFAVALLAGCGDASAGGPTDEPAPAPSAPGGALDTGRSAVTGDGPLVSFLGDSITAGLHLPAEEAFPALLGELFAAAGRPIRVVNAGLSGDTTGGGLRRLDWQLAQRPDIVVVELGGNDALRGQPLENIEDNLRSIVREAKDSGARVLLLGMRIFANYGPDYAAGFEQLYETVAREEDVAFIPFFMEGVAFERGMMLPDGLHPSAAGHAVLAETIRPALEELLDEVEADGE